jgi:predicted ABC-type transport system involved in lysophospholipase L1 biosynthesis ATPase subunit
MTQIVEACDLRVRFTGGRTAHAVNGVDILFAEGEVLGLLGESGSGKDVAVSAKHPDSRTAEMSGAPPLHNLPPRESLPRTRESSVASKTSCQPNVPYPMISKAALMSSVGEHFDRHLC